MRYFAPRFAVGLMSQTLLLLMAGCGGGDGSSGGVVPPPPPAGDITAPTVPLGVTAVTQSATSIIVSWTASTDAGAGLAGYRVYRDAGTTPIATVTTPTTTYTDNGLTAATAYSYTVRAFDAATPANVSVDSAPANATTNPNPPADTTPPTVPQNLTATVQSASSILVSWSASTDAGTGLGGYFVYRNAGANPIATVAAPATNYTDTGLTVSTLYSYTVRAYDAAVVANVSAASTAASATTSAVPATLTVQRVFQNLPNFNQPIAMLQAPGDSTRWYVVEKTGFVRSFADTANVSTTSTFIDISSRLNSNPGNVDDERGLLGMAFHPNYPTDPRVFLYYTGNPGGGIMDRVSQFRLNSGGTALDPATELELLNVADPESNHNGGNIAFGPDGYLYIGIGDGGGGGDAHGAIGNGQLLTTLLGKMLRIDIANASMATPYAIPTGATGNPYAANARCTGGTGAAPCPEIYAYGFRNPWRWSFDRGGTNELWLNDVGQSTLEEVDLVTRGGNYGWRCREGTNEFMSHITSGTCGPNSGNAIAPVAQYGRGLGFSTTGGFVYRGTAIPGLIGRYVFGDYGGRLWHIARDTPPTLTLAANSGQATGLAISSFGQGADGELYLVNLGGAVSMGTLYKIVP